MKTVEKTFKNVHFIVGVKNIAGEVKFDGFNQMIRTYNEQSEGMQNPLSHGFLHQQQLQKWLQSYNLPPIPIETVVVFSNPRTILTIQGGLTLALKKICHAPNLLMKLQELEYKHPQPRKYGYWQCPICNTTSKDAHIQALYTYFLLIKPFISVSEFAAFAHIPSIKTAFRLLSALKLHTSGIGKSTVYHAPGSLFSCSPDNQ
ncbi:nuclease-related domain-containing protein [Bacillus sp. FJAT-18017]|uniref:nuclease-related domain-containing protein n=1 Tax=Bacillus sp. FJAT-18017 TaxID=1705566 RepID=UPI0018D12A3A|nr:nuclease-related domain-containing protein [Bacillus sp. FJAT-18017]